MFVKHPKILLKLGIFFPNLIKVTMIIKTNFCEPNIGSINGCHYNNFGCWPLDIFVEQNGRMFF